MSPIQGNKVNFSREIVVYMSIIVATYFDTLNNFVVETLSEARFQFLFLLVRQFIKVLFSIINYSVQIKIQFISL